MAIDPESAFPGKITASSAEYPFGKARNITTPGDGTGTPWDQLILNDIFGFQQALLSAANIVPTGSPDEVGTSQYLEALRKIGISTFDTIALMTAVPKSELSANQRALIRSHTTIGDGGGGGFFFDKDDNTSIADGGTIFITDEGGAGRWKRIITEPWSSAWFGVVIDFGTTDNTTKIQAALGAAKGVLIENPQGAAFRLANLTFPDGNFATNKGRYALSYIANDDLSDPAHPASNDTSERMVFIQNNNPSGYNNEHIFNSGFSTGLVVDVRRDIDAPNIGAGQKVQFGRTSVVWRQDGLTRVQFKYTDSAGDTTNPGGENLDDGWTCQFIEPRVTITGIKQSSFVATLVINDMVKGSTSGARGWVKSIGANDIIVTLLSGTTEANKSGFQAGETIILEPAAETTTDTASAVSSITNTSRSNRLGFSGKQIGNLFTNIQGDNAVNAFNVGGIIGIQQGNNTNGAVINAEINLVDDLLDPTERVRLLMEAATGDFVAINGTTNKEVLRAEDIFGTSAITSQILRGSTEVESPVYFVGALPITGTTSRITSGTGSPEGVVAAGVGSFYMNISGGVGNTVWYKSTGSGNTGWIAIA